MGIPKLVVTVAMVAAGAGALAQSVSLPGATRVDDTALARVRGGFTSPVTGLSVSFGIERAVYVNGDLAASTVLRSAGAAGITLVQRGAGNSVELSGLAAGTVVQNTLDAQKIQTVTTIDVRANSLQTWNAANLRTSVGDAITASLRR